MASSRPIAAGENYTPDDINNLRADVLDPDGGHTHDGVDGARISFADLDVVGAAGSTAPAGGSKSYNEIANHVASSQEVHGLNELSYVLGCHQDGVLVQFGIDNISNPIQFPVSYDAPPVVVVTGLGAIGGIGEYLGYSVTSRTETQFVVAKGSDSPLTVMWMAVGNKNPE